MDINDLTIGQAKEIAAAFSSTVKPSGATNGDGRYVIVRSRDAGVLFGKFAGNDRDTIHLTDAVQMWRWKAAKGGTLLDCAEFGVDASGCKFSFSKARVTVFNACALIDCENVATASILAVKGGEWR